jgi:hypothetical protein
MKPAFSRTMVLHLFDKTATNICDLPASNVTPPEPHGVNAYVEYANHDRSYGQQTWRYVWINQRVQVVKQKSTLISAEPGVDPKPVFCWRKGAGPRKDFDQDAPSEGAKVKPAQQRPTASQEGSEHHPHNKKEVQAQD